MLTYGVTGGPKMQLWRVVWLPTIFTISFWHRALETEEGAETRGR